MTFFNNIKISIKLMMVFALVIILTSIQGVVSLAKLSGVNDSATLMGDHMVPALIKANDIQAAIFRVRAGQLALLGDVQDKLIGDAYEYQLKNIDIAEDNLKAINSLMLTEEGRNATLSVSKELSVLSDLLDKIVAMIKQGQVAEGKSLLRNEMTDQMRAVVVELDKLTDDYLAGRAALIADQTTEAYELSKVVISGLILFISILSIVLGMLVGRSVSAPLQRAVKVAQDVSNGDLTNHIVARGRDETGQLMTALGTMNGNLRKLVSQVHRGSIAIETAASEIAAGNLDLSTRTEQQASSLEETASAMEELTSTVKQNADNAKQANQLASSASTVAEQGGDIVREVVTTMSSIEESSKKIVDIISVIDGIAFQTNILALNAAVEAARAGEQGRGFAVVASEVRNLAQRSAGAAKEIKDLINDSVAKVGEGSNLVNKAGNTMSEVVSSIKHVTDIVAEITEASEEQSTGIEQVNKAVAQMDEMMQQNAALVEQASAATQSLKQQVNGLVKVVGQFKIDQADIHSPVIEKVISPDDIDEAVNTIIPKKNIMGIPHQVQTSQAVDNEKDITPAASTQPKISDHKLTPKKKIVQEGRTGEDWEQF